MVDWNRVCRALVAEGFHVSPHLDKGVRADGATLTVFLAEVDGELKLVRCYAPTRYLGLATLLRTYREMASLVSLLERLSS